MRRSNRRPCWIFALALLFVDVRGASAKDVATHELEVGGGTIEVSISGHSPVPEDALLRWVETCGRAVTAYLGRYPVPRVRLSIRAGGPGGVRHGVTYGGRVPSIRINVGRETTEADLREDWTLTHEMVHLSLPDLTSDDSWAEEGLATYVEPLARARVGLIREADVWSGLMDGLPKGLPRDGTGLHGTSDWGRTYWGGALFWFLADVEIREKTRNRLGLPDALAGILDAGGSIRVDWSLRETLEAGDRALGLSVLSDLYRRLGAAPGNVDLDDLWRRLGVKRVRGEIAYDDSVVLAEMRRTIMAGKPAAAP